MSSNNDYPTVEEISGWILAEATKVEDDTLVASHLLNLAKSEGIQGFDRLVSMTAIQMQSNGASILTFGLFEIAFGILLGIQVQKSISEKVDVKRVD